MVMRMDGIGSSTFASGMRAALFLPDSEAPDVGERAGRAGMGFGDAVERWEPTANLTSLASRSRSPF